jgi:amidase
LRDEGGYGLAMNFVQTKTVRDAAAMLDCLAVPQVGDPFLIPKPTRSYAALAKQPPRRLRIAVTTAPLMDAPVDPAVADAVRATAKVLADMGHAVEDVTPEFDVEEAARRMLDVWFFGFDTMLHGYAKRTGRTVGPETLEPMTLKIYEHAKTIGPGTFLDGLGFMNTARRRLGRIWVDHDVWLTPTTARVAERHGLYNLGIADMGLIDWMILSDRPVQYTFPHNVMGTPAISLPLAMHASGLPIGVQLGGRPATEHVLLQLATVLEAAMPWRDRVPPLHVSRV